VDQSSNIHKPINMSSDNAEYNEACMACMPYIAILQIHMTLSRIEEAENEYNKDTPIYIYMDS
jgi:hypothetical protein